MTPHRVAFKAMLALALILVHPIGTTRAGSVASAHPRADTGLFENAPTNNLGAMAFVPAGTTSVGTRCRALFKFDPGAFLPANATIESATLWLAVTQSAGLTSGFGLHRMFVDWGEGQGAGGPSPPGILGSPAGEGEASWYARFASTNDTPVLWTAPGGEAGVDFAAAASAFGVLGAAGTTNAFSSSGLAADVQLWLNHPETNFGWILVETNETLFGSAVRVATREDPANAPLLVVEYSVPGTPLRISSFASADGRFVFTFNAASNLAYTVESRDAFSAGAWSPLTNLPAQTSDVPVTVSDDLTTSNRFYRVRTP